MADKRVDTVRLQRVVRAYRESAALMAAIELGLFTQIAGGADNVEALAAALEMAPHNVERLTTVCVALGLLERRGGRLANAPDVAPTKGLSGTRQRGSPSSGITQATSPGLRLNTAAAAPIASPVAPWPTAQGPPAWLGAKDASATT